MPTKKTKKIEKTVPAEPQEITPAEEIEGNTDEERRPDIASEPHVPEDKAAFIELLKKFRIGVKGDFYETIADDIATTGGEFVFERPDLLAKKMQDWHQYIEPPTRKQMLEYWFTKKNIRVPTEVIKEAGMNDVEREKAEKDKHHDEKYSVDTATGVIKVADSSDKSPLSWGEAEKLSQRIKSDLMDQKNRDKKDTDGEAKKTPFVLDAEGNVKIADGAQLSASDLLIVQAINKSQAQGEKRTAREILEEEMKHQEFIDSLRGRNAPSGGLLDNIDQLVKAKELFGTNKELLDTLTLLSKKMDDAGNTGKESPVMEALRAQITDLTRRLDDQEKQTLRDQIAAQNAKLEAFSLELKKQGSSQAAKSEYDIMGKAMDKIDGAGKDIKETILTLLQKPAPPMAAMERSAITEAISEEASKITAKQELGKQIFTRPPRGT
ncbi:MAG: hypothetical protein PHI12_06540 [Dehalococcoidales bacterium]|nr:hypothetical protein [Dehalococcoidales bacterium]